MIEKKNKRSKREKVSQAICAKSYPTISACIIVKDEEEQLPRCLKSIKDYVDEIIVVDTGSTDRTVGIAKSFGANIYQHPRRSPSEIHPPKNGSDILPGLSGKLS